MKKDVENLNIELSKDKFKSIDNIARDTNVQSFSVFLACLYILLYRYLYSSKIKIKSFFSKESSSFDDITLTENIDCNMSFNDFLILIDKEAKTSSSVSNLEESLDAYFSYQTQNEIELDNAKLWFKVLPEFNTLNLKFTSSFETNFAKSLLAHYLFILKQVYNGQNPKISDISMITPEETHLLEKFNGQNTNFDDKTALFVFDPKTIKVHILDENMLQVPIGNTR